jgi:SAM-dependent methyltransferase
VKKRDTGLNMHLILQYYVSGQEDRQRELDACLQKNLDNPFIARVYLLTEETVDLSHLRQSDKIAQTVIGERLTYERAFHFANAHARGGAAWILANADIYFDESLRYLADADMKGKMFALTRHDIQKDGSLMLLPPAYAQGSQDAWIFVPPVPLDTMSTRFSLGIPGCDSKIAYEFVKAGYRVVNPSKKIILHHLDLTREIDPVARAREYRAMSTAENIRAGKVVPPPYYYVFPTSALHGIPLWEEIKKYVEAGRELMRRRQVTPEKIAENAGHGKENMYTSGTYIDNNPTLDAEDVPWKITKLIPLVDLFMQRSRSSKVGILDVGGGAGLYLKGISDYVRANNITVIKYALDLSGEMLRRQKEHNPDLASVFECSIERTPFKDKEFDLVLMIDVLEHIPDAPAALGELGRIAKYVIFKVPMENNLYYNMLNLVKMGGLKRDIFRKVGHLNFYSYRTFKKQIGCIGDIVQCDFTNVFEFWLSARYHRGTNLKEKMVFTAAKYIFKLSPRLCSYLFPDSIACLVQCR